MLGSEERRDKEMSENCISGFNGVYRLLGEAPTQRMQGNQWDNKRWRKSEWKQLTTKRVIYLPCPSARKHNYCKTFSEYGVLQFTKYFQKKDDVSSWVTKQSCEVRSILFPFYKWENCKQRNKYFFPDH